MGLYDSVYITCPECGHKNEIQSKQDVCQLAKYDFSCIEEIPESILEEINSTVHKCNNCMSLFGIHIKWKVMKIPVKSTIELV